jgi:hypothetical protein
MAFINSRTIILSEARALRLPLWSRFFLGPQIQIKSLRMDHTLLQGLPQVHRRSGNRVQSEHVSIAHSIFWRGNWCELYQVSLSPLQGDSFILRFPGLKPWAESCSPSGAKTVPKAPYLRAIQPWAMLFRPLRATDWRYKRRRKFSDVTF